MRLDGAVDLGTIASCGPRAARARAMLDGMVEGARSVRVAAGDDALAFVVVARGNEDLDAGLVLDVLAVAALRLAEQEQ